MLESDLGLWRQRGPPAHQDGAEMNWEKIKRVGTPNLGRKDPDHSALYHIDVELSAVPPEAWARYFGSSINTSVHVPRLNRNLIRLRAAKDMVDKALADVDHRISMANNQFEQNDLPRIRAQQVREQAQRDAEKAERDKIEKRLQASQQPAPVDVMSNYEEVRPIGGGGMGTVTLVRHRRTGREYAAKRIKAEFLKRRPDALRRFRREIDILCRVQHPAIVAIHDQQLDERAAVFVMDYHEGGDLSAAINDSTVKSADLVAALRPVAEGIQHFHDAGGVHRDLKPQNILLDASRTKAYLSDFGIAVLRPRDTTTLTGRGLGTPLYAAPEQASKASTVGPEADYYAFALIGYEVLTRQSPFAQPLNYTRGSGPYFDALPDLLGAPSNRSSPTEVWRLLSEQLAIGAAAATTQTDPAPAMDVRIPHQQAFLLWKKLCDNAFDPKAIGPVVMEAQDWWNENCMYLNPEIRSAFKECYLAAGQHHQYLEGARARSGNHDIVENNWAKIERLRELLMNWTPESGSGEVPPTALS